MSCIAVLFSLRSHSSAALDAAEVALITLRCFGHSLTFSFRDCFRMVSLPQVAITNLLISNIVVLTTEYDCSNAKALPASGQQLLEGWLFSWWFCSRHCETWCELVLSCVGNFIVCERTFHIHNVQRFSLELGCRSSTTLGYAMLSSLEMKTSSPAPTFLEDSSDWLCHVMLPCSLALHERENGRLPGGVIQIQSIAM